MCVIKLQYLITCFIVMFPVIVVAYVATSLVNKDEHTSERKEIVPYSFLKVGAYVQASVDARPL